MSNTINVESLMGAPCRASLTVRTPFPEVRNRKGTESGLGAPQIEVMFRWKVLPILATFDVEFLWFAALHRILKFSIGSAVD